MKTVYARLMRDILGICAFLLGAFCAPQAHAGTTVGTFTITGTGISGSGTITLMTTATPGVDEVIGMTGTFSTTSGGFSGAIIGMSPASYNSNNPTVGAFDRYDNLFYPSGSAPGVNGNPAGGTLDDYGLDFMVAGGYSVNVFERGTVTGFLLDDGLTSNVDHRVPVNFVVAFGPTPTVTAIQNFFDYSTNLCPGAGALILGANFGSSSTGVTISVGGQPAYINAVTSTVISVQLPFDAPTGATTVIVTVGGVPSSPFALTLNTYAPTFLTFNQTASGAVHAGDSNGNQPTSTTPANPGDVVFIYATGLGPTNPAIPAGKSASGANTSTLPTLTVGGQPATVTASVTVGNLPGFYRVTFTVPAGVQGDAPLVLTIGGVSTNPPSPVTLPVFGISAIVSNASFGSSGIAAACSIASIFGNGFGTVSQSAGFPSTTFQGVSVTFNGTPAPFFHLTITAPAAATATTAATLGQSQIDLLIPCELPASGQVEVALTNSSATTPNFALTMAAGAPGLYFQQDPSDLTRYNVLAQFNNTAWLAMPASMAAALNYPGNCTADNVSPTSFCAQPAAPGSYLVLYLTGLGLATPNGNPNGQPLTTGDVPPADGSVLYETVATPTVTVGGLPVKVLFSGMSPGFAGLYQIDFQVPDGVIGDDIPVVVSISGSPADARTVSIQIPAA